MHRSDRRIRSIHNNGSSLKLENYADIIIVKTYLNNIPKPTTANANTVNIKQLYLIIKSFPLTDPLSSLTIRTFHSSDYFLTARNYDFHQGINIQNQPDPDIPNILACMIQVLWMTSWLWADSTWKNGIIEDEPFKSNTACNPIQQGYFAIRLTTWIQQTSFPVYYLIDVRCFILNGVDILLTRFKTLALTFIVSRSSKISKTIVHVVLPSRMRVDRCVNKVGLGIVKRPIYLSPKVTLFTSNNDQSAYNQH